MVAHKASENVLFSFVAKILIILFGCSVLVSCGQLKVRVGDEIDTSLVARLHIGVSTEEDVRAILGEPFGTGRSYLPFQDEHLDMWSYYYELGKINLGTVSDDRRTFLFVYLDDGIFDGYMWFSSLPETLR